MLTTRVWQDRKGKLALRTTASAIVPIALTLFAIGIMERFARLSRRNA
jgi:hypothetical protein